MTSTGGDRSGWNGSRDCGIGQYAGMTVCCAIKVCDRIDSVDTNATNTTIATAVVDTIAAGVTPVVSAVIETTVGTTVGTASFVVFVVTKVLAILKKVSC